MEHAESLYVSVSGEISPFQRKGNWFWGHDDLDAECVVAGSEGDRNNFSMTFLPLHPMYRNRASDEPVLIFEYAPDEGRKDGKRSLPDGTLAGTSSRVLPRVPSGRPGI